MKVRGLILESLGSNLQAKVFGNLYGKLKERRKMEIVKQVQERK